MLGRGDLGYTKVAWDQHAVSGRIVLMLLWTYLNDLPIASVGATRHFGNSFSVWRRHGAGATFGKVL